MTEYVTVKKEASDFFVEKKSRFIGYCKPVKTEEQALEFIAEIKKKHYDATHNVYAYILRESGLMRFSDDGEPQGTAGIPVIEAMKKAGVTDLVIVATRYFGGTLLGGGGLIRAYSHTASIGMAAAEKVCMKQCFLAELACDYNLYGKIQAVLPECRAVIDSTDFLESVVIKFHIEPEKFNQLEKKLADVSNGQIGVNQTEKQFFEFEIER